MSVVIAIKENGVIYMGTDTQVTSGNKKENELNKNSFKIALLDNGLLVGVCGNYGLKQQIIADKSIFTLDLYIISFRNISNVSELIELFPVLPISSLSTKSMIAVLDTFSPSESSAERAA